jgi:hypothetical protein
MNMSSHMRSVGFYPAQTDPLPDRLNQALLSTHLAHERNNMSTYSASFWPTHTEPPTHNFKKRSLFFSPHLAHERREHEQPHAQRQLPSHTD